MSINRPLNLEEILDKMVNTLSNIELDCKRLDTKKKGKIIGSIYPEKLTFSESE